MKMIFVTGTISHNAGRVFQHHPTKNDNPCAHAQQSDCSVCRFVSMFVCSLQQNEHFEQNRLVYDLYLLHMSQKLTSTYLTNESVLQGAEEKQPFFAYF